MGSFVIRPSDKSFAALSMVSPSGQYHMHIESDDRGVIKGLLESLFPSFSQPCSLSLYKASSDPNALLSV